MSKLDEYKEEIAFSAKLFFILGGLCAKATTLNLRMTLFANCAKSFRIVLPSIKNLRHLI
jgi:hypothetical protein